jgi:SSS family solute:Na+ symporter
MFGAMDWIVVVAYFAAVFAVAVWGNRSMKTGGKASDDYFLAGRSAVWFLVGSSLFASNIGSEHLVGLAGTGAASGLAVAQFEILAALMLILLGWIFVPIYAKSGIYTMPEFLEKRYSPAARWYLAIVSILAYVLTKISVTVAAGAIVFETLMGIDFWTGAVIVVSITGLYTVFGGLIAVLYTDMFQMFMLIGGALLVTILGLQQAGGWSAIQDAVGPEMLSVWKPIDDPDFPWTGILLGAPILGMWYWCTDQFIVQRVLSAKNIEHARGGAIFAGFLKLLPLFIFVIPGIIAFTLNRQGFLQLQSPDQALPALIGSLLPAGLRGLVVAGLLAALMSSLSSVFNSCSTLITVDVYKKLKPQASERQLLLFGQAATAVMVLLGLLWVPLIELISGQIYQYLQKIQAYIAPPIAAVFLLGITTRRTSGTGAMAALTFGFIAGMSRLVLELNQSWLKLPETMDWFVQANFLHFAFGLFIVSAAFAYLVKPRTQAEQSDAALANLPHIDMLRGVPVPPLLAGATVLLLALVGIIWWIFSPLYIG